MKVVVAEEIGQPLVTQEIPPPSVGDRDALVRVEACGVCHTDLHIVEGMLAEAGVAPPIVLGHEAVGVVEDAGSEVTHLKTGDRVGVYWFFGCGYCQGCIAGEDQACELGPPAPMSGKRRRGQAGAAT